MSAPGQKSSSARRRGSLISRQAAVDPEVRVVPTGDSAPKQAVSLFDNFIRSGKQGRRDSDAECRGRLQIDGQFELRRLHDGQLGRWLAFQDSSNICAGLTPGTAPAGTIAKQASRRSKLGQWIDRRDSILDGQLGKPCAFRIK